MTLKEFPKGKQLYDNIYVFKSMLSFKVLLWEDMYY